MSSALHIDFLGIEEGADPKNLPPGTLLRADNCAMDKTKRLVKRAGTTGLAKTALSGSNVATGKRLLTVGEDTSLTDGQTAWTYIETLAKWNPLDRPPCWRVTKRALTDSTRSIPAVDTAISGSLLVSVYITTTDAAYFQVDDLETGSPIVPATLIAATVGGISAPRVLVSGTSAYFIFAIASSVSIYPLDLTTLVLGAGASLVTTSRTVPSLIDAVIGTPNAGVPTLYLAYEEQSGASRMVVASFTVSTLAAVASAASVGTGIRCISMAFCQTSQKVTVAFSSATSTSTRLTSFATDLTGQIGPTQIYAGISDSVFVAEDDVTNVIAGWNRNDGGDFTRTEADRLTTALYSQAAFVQVASSARITFGLYKPTKPWRTASRWYVSATTYVHPYSITSQDPIAQPSTVVVEIETANSLTGVQNATHPHVATLQNYTGWFGLGQPQPAVDSDGAVWLASPYRNREPDNYTVSIAFGWDVFRLAASEGDTFRPTAVGAAALCAGGAPVWFDGASTMPFGFAHAPQIISVTAVAGGAAVAGTYSYVATYAWRDANGVLHRSAPSAPKTGTTSGADLTLSVKVATSSLSPKQRTLTAANSANPILIELWRTTIGGTSPHYRLTLEPSYQVLVNDPRAADVTLSDTKADAKISSGSVTVALASQAQLYTDTGELENIPPPSFITVTTHRGRLAGIGPDLRTVWLSKDSTQDATVAPGFNEALTLAFANDKTSLASLDTALVVFGEDKIDVIQGDGPDATGGGRPWEIQAVQTDSGCVNPRSPVVFPGGVIFESRTGLSLLDRGLNVTWLGQHVVETLTTYPNITSGVLVAEETEVRWTCDDGETGIVLAFDYLNGRWFVRKYNDAADTDADSIRFVDAALIDGVYTLLTAGGQVYRETSAHKLDNGTEYVERDILLAPISAQPGRSGWSNDNLGWARVKDLTLMGTSVTDHDLEVSFAHDYSETFTQTKTFRAGSDVTTPGPLEKSRVTCVRQKCQAVQIRIRDLAPTAYSVGTGEGAIFESLALRVGALDGPARTSPEQRG